MNNQFGYLLLSLIIMGSILSIGTLRITPAYAGSDSIVSWNNLTTDLSLEHKFSPPRLARAHALVHVAIYDALLEARNQNIANTPENESALISGAASEVLVYLFADKTETINKFASSVAIPNAGFNFGRDVGKQIVNYAKTDGSDAVFSGQIPVGDCLWTGTNPLEPTAGQWKTFILASGAEVQPPAPELCTSDKYKEQIQQIIDASNNRTPEQIAAIHYWGDSPPPTIWNEVLNERIQNLDTFSAARASAYLNVGMYDAAVSTWRTKFTYWTERPFQAIPDLKTEIPTPNFPGYTSGHATFSGAASVIMSELFASEKGYFVAQADEANMSRMWGGIHLLQDCDEGLAVGQKIGEKVVADMKKNSHLFIYQPVSTTALPDNTGLVIGGVISAIAIGIAVFVIKRRKN